MCHNGWKTQKTSRSVFFFRSSDFLGDPPPDPRFLASLGALSWVELHHCFVGDLVIWCLKRPFEGPSEASDGESGELFAGKVEGVAPDVNSNKKIGFCDWSTMVIVRDANKSHDATSDIHQTFGSPSA
jgi:hypothetical protein